MTETLVTFLASFLIWILFAGLFIFWIVDGKVTKEMMLHAIAASVVAWVITQMIKSITPMARPFMTNGFPHLTVTQPQDSSFPSTHSAMAFALAVAIWQHDKRWGVVYMIAALLIGAARIIGNVHYPVDILVGIVIGVAAAMAIERLHLFQVLRTKGKGR